MKQTHLLIFFELVLIFSSILIFRSVWMFLDANVWASSAVGLIALFVAGIILTIWALSALNRKV